MSKIKAIYQSPKIQLALINATKLALIYSKYGTLGSAVYAANYIVSKIK